MPSSGSTGRGRPASHVTPVHRTPLFGVLALLLLSLLATGAIPAPAPLSPDRTVAAPPSSAGVSTAGPSPLLSSANGLHVLSTVALGNGSVAPGNPTVPSTAVPIGALYDTRTHDVGWVGSYDSWIDFFNASAPAHSTWANLTGPGLNAAAFDPLTNLTYSASYNGGTGRGTLEVENDSNGSVVRAVNLGSMETEGLTVGDGGQFLFATAVFCNCISAYSNGWLTAINVSSFAGIGQLYLNTTWTAPAGNLAFDPLSDEVFVTEPRLDLVQVVNVTNVHNMTTVANLSVTNPQGIVVDTADSLVYVASGSGGLVAIDPTTNQVVLRNNATPPVLSLAYDPASDRIYVPGENGSLYVLNGSSADVDAIVDPGPQDTLRPAGFSVSLFDPAANALVVGGQDGEVLVLAPSGTVLRTFWTGGLYPGDATYNPANGEIYVDTNSGVGSSSPDANPVEVLNGTTGALAAWVPDTYGFSSFFDPVLGETILERSGGLTAVDAATNLANRNVTVAGGVNFGPGTGTYDSDSGFLYLLVNGTVGVFNASTLVLTRTLPYSSPTALLAVPSDHELFLARGANTVTILNATTNAPLANVTTTAGCDPSGLAYDPSDDEVYVANSICKNLSVIDASSHARLADIPVPDWQATVTYDPAAEALVATAPYSNQVFVIADRNNTLVGAVRVQAFPLSAAYDPSDGYLFVVNNGATSLSVLTARLEVASFTSQPAEATVNQSVTLNAEVTGGVRPIQQFTYSGLPPGCASVNSSQLSCDPSALGSYLVNFSAEDSSGAFANASYRLEVAPPLAVVDLASSARRTTTGVPLTLWWNVSGGWGGINRSYVGLPGGCSSENATPLPCTPSAAGNFTIVARATDGSGATVTASLALEVSPPSRYPVTFQESGLASGSEWTVVLAGTTSSASTPEIVVDEPNGTYAFAITGPPGTRPVPRTGNVTVAGGPGAVAIVFAATGPTTYSVSFRETGLPTGEGWVVSLDGVEESSTNASVVFSEVANGSHTYGVSAVGYLAQPASGTVTVSGAPVEQGIEFRPIPATYVVTFEAAGLAEGARWSVTFHGTTLSTTGATFLAFPGVPNGSYSFQVAAAGYVADPGNGTVSVAGANVSWPVTFTVSPAPTYSVEFLASGLPVASTWTVTFADVSRSAAGSSAIDFAGNANGTYAFTVVADGYNATPAGGSVLVAGAPVTRTIDFVAVTSHAPGSGRASGLSPAELLGLGAGAVLVVAAVLALLLWRRRHPPPEPPSDGGARSDRDEPPSRGPQT